MKKMHIIAALLAMLIPVTQVWAGSSSKYYAQLKTTVKSGLGKVYAATASTAESSRSYNASSSTSSTKQTTTSGGSVSGFYAYAKPDYGYKFVKWTDTSGNSKSTNAEYTNFSLNASGTKNGTLTTEYYAYFEEKTHYTVNLAVPAVSGGFASYSVTGDNGYSRSQHTSDGSFKAYSDETYAITCTRSDEDAYEFKGWEIDGVLTETSSTTLSQKFTSGAAVKAVLKEKTKYAVTLAKPAVEVGFQSYTVTRTPTGTFNGSSFSQGGSFEAHDGETYTFKCTISNTYKYEFVGWAITENGTMTTNSSAELTKTFSSPTTTVAAVLREKAHYTVYLERPAVSAGFGSYTVTGPTGFDGSGLSNGGTMTAYYDGTYNFICTVGNTYAYEFVGWDVNGTVTQTSSTTLSKQFSSEATVKAVLREKVNYAVTLAMPELAVGFNGYTVTGPSGFDGSGLSNGGPIKSYYDGAYNFECAINDEYYKFVKWTVTDSNGTLLEESTDRPFSKTFTAPVTVTAVLAAKEPYEVTFVTPEHVIGYSITGPNGAVPISAEGKATVYELNSYIINCEYDDENYELVNWTVSDSSGSSESSASTLAKTFTSDATVTVTLAKIEAFIATCPAVPFGCSYKVRGGTTTSDETVTTTEKKVKGAKGQPLTVTLSTATAGSGYVFAGWYIENQDGSKTYISKDSSVTQTFETHVTIGADFVSASSTSKAALVVKASGGYGEYDDLKVALDSLESGDIITICKSATLAESAGVPQGVTMTVASGVTLTVAIGQTLYVDGAVNGTISGTVSQCTKLIKQTGDGTDDSGKPKPFNPYGSVKYWKTTITSSSITISGASSHATIMNGYGQSFRFTLSSSAKLIRCTKNASIAVNHITGFVSESTSVNVVNNTVGSDMVILLGADCVINGGLSSKTGFAGVVDCANNNCSTVSGVEVSGNNGKATFLNCPSFTGRKVINITHDYFNCTKVTLSSFNAGGSPILNFYDCGTASSQASFSASFSKGPSDTSKFNFYSGFYASMTYKTCYVIYGGYYKSNPGSEGSYLATGLNLKAKTESVSGTSFYHVYVDVPDNVAQIGDSTSNQYETLQEAVNAVANGQTIKLLKNYDVNETVMVTSGKSFTLNLSGYSIVGTSGKIINNGTVRIVDHSGGNGACSYAIDNNGTMDITYGTYSGIITLNSGMLTTHNGKFTGTIEFGDGVSNPADVVAINGGMFKKSVRNLLIGDFCEVSHNGLYYVGEFPYAIKSSASLSGAEKSWSLTALSSADRTIYLKASKTRSAFNSDADWERYAELDSRLTPYRGFTIDCVLSFDRAVAKGSVKAYANAKVNVSDTLDRALAANESYRVLSPKVASAGYYQIDFYRFLVGEDCPTTLSAGIADVNSANPGTVATIELELCHSNRTTHVLNRDYAIATCRYMLGGKKAAIDRGARRVAYNSLTEAVADVQDGETILVGADTSENVTFNNPGTYVINEYGFAFTGSATAKEGYDFAETTGTDANGFVTHTYVVSTIGPSHPADYVVIPSEHLTEWETDNGITGSTESEIREALKQEDDNGIAKWENVVMGQNGGDKPAIETSTNGTETVADMVVSFKAPENTGYTVKYAFDKVDDAGSVVASGTAQENPQLDLTQVTTAGEPAYFKMRAVLESNDHSITTNVPVEHTVGVLKVESSATYTIIAVPWKSFHNTDVNVSELVHAASLSEDDMLQAYDDEGNLKSWRVSKDGVWVKMTEQQEDGQLVVTPDPAGFGIARGKGAWLKRSNTSKPIYLMGMPPTSETVTTTLPAAESSAKPSWNLVASPKLETVDIASKFKDNTADEIIVPTAGTPKHYTCKNGEWGYPGAEETITKPGPGGKTITIIQSTRITDDTRITPGTGFWYLNKDNTSKTISW